MLETVLIYLAIGFVYMMVASPNAIRVITYLNQQYPVEKQIKKSKIVSMIFWMICLWWLYLMVSVYTFFRVFYLHIVK